MTSKDTKDVKNVKEDTAATPANKLFTRAEVAKHTDSKDIWLIIHNNVYDITSFISQHPGGEEVLLEQGGHDGTEPFEDIGHSTDAREMMESYKIGEIVEEEKTKAGKSSRNWTDDADSSRNKDIVTKKK
ncbi:cytochrome b5 isoform X2 [Linepithema humile]|uniref:cytochrome b5 isoform X2 n=1 Tax=Linepithema humile TaxID=83485 RepID=UPI00351F6B18